MKPTTLLLCLSSLAMPLRAAPNYPEAVAADRPVAQWRFEEAANPAGGAVAKRVDFVFASSGAPALGHSARFAQDSFIDLPAPAPLTTPGDFTVEWWQYADKFIDAAPIVSLVRPDGTSIFEASVRPVTPPAPKVKKKGAKTAAPKHFFSAGPKTLSKAQAYANRWTHVAVTRLADGSVQFYVNGLPDHEPVAGPKPTASPDARLVIGRSGKMSGFWGLLDEIAVYDHALPDDRVLAHYKAALATLPNRDQVTSTGHRGDNANAPENTNVS